MTRQPWFAAGRTMAKSSAFSAGNAEVGIRLWQPSGMGGVAFSAQLLSITSIPFSTAAWPHGERGLKYMHFHFRSLLAVELIFVVLGDGVSTIESTAAYCPECPESRLSARFPTKQQACRF